MNPIKGLSIAAGGAVAAIAVAVAVTGFNPLDALRQQPQNIQPQAPAAPDAQNGTAPGESKPAGTAPAEAAKEIVIPAFNIVRVEPDGSLIVAGNAAPDAAIELVAGTQIVGTTKAEAGGDFVIVLDNPLKPGDYQMVLRATAPDGTVTTSTETATVSVPETADGQVLALVEQPGAPSRLITKPKAAPQEPVPAAPAPGAAPEKPEAPAAEEKPASPAQAEPQQSAKAEPGPAKSATEPSAPPANVVVEAVEIEGRKIFVAGVATPGARVRVHANDILLGEAVSSPGGRFLVETTRDLPVGDYIIRAEMYDKAGVNLLARATVPFRREEGEKIAAVAPEKPAAAEPAKTAAPAEKVPGTVAPATPPKAAETAPAPLEPATGSVIIRKGDTLWQISRRVYGRGVRYTTIYLANEEQITDPHKIWPGQVFKVPETSHDGQPADMSTVAPTDGVAPKAD